MIEHFEFDHANENGNKEAVILPNPPTLINKLSANEINGIKNKINEIIDKGDAVPYGDLKVFLKGNLAGIPNTGTGIEVGDVVHGFATDEVIWTKAIYNGGDPNERSSYTPTIEEPNPNEVFLVDFAALGISSFEEATQGMIIDWINTQPYVNAEAVIIKLVAELPPPPSNDRFFDVRMDWEYIGVTDQQTFSDTFYVECENFVLLEEGNRIQCDYISGGGGEITIDNGVIFALPRISWDSLSASNSSFGVDFIFPESFFSIQMNDYPDASIPDLPTEILDQFDIFNAPNLTSFPDLPPTMMQLAAKNCPLIDQVAIDKLATEFLQGDLPKSYWDSNDTIEPSAALKQQIIDNTTYEAQF